MPTHLPDNPADWPRDPYALLGIARDVDERGLRRAYAALIRKFNPEHSPEEFRLTRDAFESVRQQLQWREIGGFSVESDLAFSGTASSTSETGSPKESPGTPSHATGPSLAAELAIAWTHAKSGDWEQAHRQLAELARHHPHNEEVRLRRYWLQSLGHGDVSQQPAIELLRPHVQTQGLLGRIGHLYLRELERHPGELLTEQTAAILVGNCEPGLLLVLCRLRWRQATAHDDWAVVQQDLARLEPLLMDQWSLWASLQIAVLELAHAVSHPVTRQLIEQAREAFAEVGGMSDLQFRYHLLEQAD
ncbi:MAG: hypothetical protein KDA58_16895, partial [Planctomycetaceae bacterium]|nr:hypothetical protein [Planctomycetaceae bacterium]